MTPNTQPLKAVVNTLLQQNIDVSQNTMRTIIQIDCARGEDNSEFIADLFAKISDRFDGKTDAPLTTGETATAKLKTKKKAKPALKVVVDQPEDEDDIEDDDEEEAPKPKKKKKKAKKKAKPEHSMDDIKKLMADAIEVQVDDDSPKKEINAARKNVQKVFIDCAGVSKSADIEEEDFAAVIEGLNDLIAEYEDDE